MSAEHQNIMRTLPENNKTSLISRNITVLGHRTSIRLEPEMWTSLREISTREKCTIHDLCTVDSIRKSPNTSLTAAIRVFIMLYFRSAATEDGHSKAGHGDFNIMKKRARITDQALAYFTKLRKKGDPQTPLPEAVAA